MKKVRSKLRPTEIGVIKTFSLSPDDEVGEIAVQCRGCTYYYNNLAELCEKWEDMPEEPKGFWMINILGVVEYVHDLAEVEVEMMKEIGNYFETKEEAEKAVEKLKAFTRLEDKGFRFRWIDKESGNIKYAFYADLSIKPGEINRFDYEDLDLLFGGEDE